MAEKVKIWFDPEGDFLEAESSGAPGFMRPTAYEAFMERVDEHGMSGIQRPRRQPFQKGPPSRSRTHDRNIEHGAGSPLPAALSECRPGAVLTTYIPDFRII